MKKILLLAAFVAGPILFAQQKPISSKELQKADVLQTEHNKTAPATQTTEAKPLNANQTKAEQKNTATKATEDKWRRKGQKASNSKTSVEN